MSSVGPPSTYTRLLSPKRSWSPTLHDRARRRAARSGDQAQCGAQQRRTAAARALTEVERNSLSAAQGAQPGGPPPELHVLPRRDAPLVEVCAVRAAWVQHKGGAVAPPELDHGVQPGGRGARARGAWWAGRECQDAGMQCRHGMRRSAACHPCRCSCCCCLSTQVPFPWRPRQPTSTCGTPSPRTCCCWGGPAQSRLWARGQRPSGHAPPAAACPAGPRSS